MREILVSWWSWLVNNHLHYDGHMTQILSPDWPVVFVYSKYKDMILFKWWISVPFLFICLITVFFPILCYYYDINMDSIYHISRFHTLLKELYVFGNLIVFLPWSSVYELLLSLFAILCFILYLKISGLPLSPE